MSKLTDCLKGWLVKEKEELLTPIKSFKSKDWFLIMSGLIAGVLNVKFNDDNISADLKYNVIGPIMFLCACYTYAYVILAKSEKVKKSMWIMYKLAFSLTVLPLMIMAVLAFVWYKFSWITDGQLYSFFFPVTANLVLIGLISMFILGVIEYYKRRLG